MVIYGTFDGFKNYKNLSSKFKWSGLSNEMGNEIKGNYLSHNDKIFKEVRLKIGERYQLECDSLITNQIIEIGKVTKVNKNPRCDLFRRFKDEFHIINGKYQGKKDTDILDYEMSMYCIWVARKTNNEATMKNCLALLEKIQKNETRNVSNKV